MRDEYGYPKTSNEKGIPNNTNPWGPPELWPGQRNPYYDLNSSQYVRQLGAEEEKPIWFPTPLPDENNMKYDEVKQLNISDDTVNNGIFDSLLDNNLNQDEGVFEDHANLPGYLAREQFYSPSEVIDLTTGKPVNYVPGGATSFQQGQVPNYYKNLALLQMPKNIDYDKIDMVQIDQAPTQAQAISQDLQQQPDATTEFIKKLLIGSILGIGSGYILYQLTKRKEL